MTKILALAAILTLLLSASAFARETEADSYEVLIQNAQPGVVADDGPVAPGVITLDAQGSESAAGGANVEGNGIQRGREAF